MKCRLVFKKVVERKLTRTHIETILCDSVVSISPLAQDFSIFGAVTEDGLGNHLVFLRRESLTVADIECTISVHEERRGHVMISFTFF